jgi:hypothetical protein
MEISDKIFSLYLNLVLKQLHAENYWHTHLTWSHNPRKCVWRTALCHNTKFCKWCTKISLKENCDSSINHTSFQYQKIMYQFYPQKEKTNKNKWYKNNLKIILLITFTWIWHIILIITTQNMLFLLLKCNPLCCPWCMWIVLCCECGLLLILDMAWCICLAMFIVYHLSCLSGWLWDADVHNTLISPKSVDFMSRFRIMFIRNILILLLWLNFYISEI